MLNSILLCALLAAPPIEDEPDVLVLEGGKEVPCRVLYEDGEKVIARARNRSKEYARADVQQVISIERSLREFLEQFGNLGANDVAGMVDLAKFAESRELLGEARSMWIRILTVDAENELAWTKLGGIKGRKGWKMKVRGRFYTIESLRDRVSDWKNAMELPTAHFLLKTDIEPEKALDISIDLERAYFAFYDIFGPLLELHVFDEIPEIYVYSDPEDYPTPPTPRQAWFSYVGNTLHVLGTEDRNPHEIAGNLTYALLFNSFHRTLGKSGNIAPWARRGLAEGFAAAVRPNPGKTRWEVGAPYLPYFQRQMRDADPLSLKDVIRAGLASFDSGRNAERYVSQSYTLVHFLAFGAERKYREGFAEYLVSSFMGKGSFTHFERLLGVDLGDLEAEWNAYVSRVAGG